MGLSIFYSNNYTVVNQKNIPQHLKSPTTIVILIILCMQGSPVSNVGLFLLGHRSVCWGVPAWSPFVNRRGRTISGADVETTCCVSVYFASKK